MILPPFFGYPLSYKDREIYRVYYSSLGHDFLTYKQPEFSALVSYVAIEILQYDLPCDLQISII
jgi:hypothetical protein